MGTVASGSIDLKSLKVAGEEVNKYITTINNGGIKVHPENNTTDYVQIDGNSLDIYSGGNEVGSYGTTTRIGTTEDASITITDSSIKGVGEDKKEFFNFANSEATIDTTSYTTRDMSSMFVDSFPAQRDEAICYKLDLPKYSVFTSIKFRINYWVYQSTNETKYVNFSFGTSSQTTVSFIFDDGNTHIINVYYDGTVNIYVWLEEGYSGNGELTLGCYAVIKTSIVAPSYELGGKVDASGGYALAEGYETKAKGNYSHAEGYKTYAEDKSSHAEGEETKAYGGGTGGAHAEGRMTEAYDGSHAEGYKSEAYLGSHAEGNSTIAGGVYSHTSGLGTYAYSAYQTVIGQYNEVDNDADPRDTGNYAFIIGNGSSDGSRSNSLTVDWSGNVDIADGAKYKINGNNLSASDVGAVPTTRTVNGKALSANIADADYVTAQGTSGAWKYRKWNSGKVEAWAYISFTSTTPAVWASPIRYIDKTFTIPSGIFASAPRMTGSSNSSQYWAVDVSASSSTAGSVRFCTVASSALTPYIQIYAWTN